MRFCPSDPKSKIRAATFQTEGIEVIHSSNILNDFKILK